MLALAFGGGAAAGWGFCQKTVLALSGKATDKLIAFMEVERERERSELSEERERERRECTERIDALEARLKEVENRYMNGMERQLAQIRQSTVAVIAGQPDTQEPR